MSSTSPLSARPTGESAESLTFSAKLRLEHRGSRVPILFTSPRAVFGKRLQFLGSLRQSDAAVSARVPLHAAKCKQKSSSYVHPNRNLSNATCP
jgi:hypothetical protein